MCTRFHRLGSFQYACYAFELSGFRLPQATKPMDVDIPLYYFSLLRKKIVRLLSNLAWADKILKRLVDPFPGKQAGCSRPSTLGIGLADPGATTFTTYNQSQNLKRRTA